MHELLTNEILHSAWPAGCLVISNRRRRPGNILSASREWAKKTESAYEIRE